MSRLPWLAAVVGVCTFPATAVFNDQTATWLPARQLLTHGTVRLGEVTGPAGLEVFDGLSDRMPGMIAMLLPFAWLPLLPALALAAGLWLFVTAWLLERLYGRHAALVVLCCSPQLFVGREFWPQTVCVPLLLAGLWFVRREQLGYLVPASLVLVTVRPPFVVLAVLLWAWEARTALSRKRVLALGSAGAAAGCVLLLAWSQLLFHRWGLTGGFVHEVHGGYDPLRTLYTGLVSPQRGVLFYCPWLLLVAWDRRLCLVAAYVVAEWWQFDAWGGNGFYGFRYALPLVVLAAGRLRPSRLLPVLAGWSAGLSLWCLLVDKYALVNEARDPNLISPALALAGAAGLVLGSAWVLLRGGGPGRLRSSPGSPASQRLQALPAHDDPADLRRLVALQ